MRERQIMSQAPLPLTIQCLPHNAYHTMLTTQCLPHKRYQPVSYLGSVLGVTCKTAPQLSILHRRPKNEAAGKNKRGCKAVPGAKQQRICRKIDQHGGVERMADRGVGPG